MRVRSSPVIALVVALSGLAGCSGGAAGGGSATFGCASPDPSVICLQSCNLGCSSTGCQRTSIAQNEIIVLQFSHDVDPASVSSSSIRFRNAAGDQPVGEFFVNGNQVEFVPTLQVSGGQTFFGFTSGETYTMTIPGGANQPAVVRSTSGKAFDKTLTCTLNSVLGIIDHNGVPPSATLVAPNSAQVNSAPRDIDIVLEFNELIDATPFLSGISSPVNFAVRRTRASINGGRECDPDSEPSVLSGTQRLEYDAARSVSVLTFRPVTILPGNVCVEITVTNGVQDLSGRPAQSQFFSYLTEVVPLVEDIVTEEFDDADQLDRDASAGTWESGVATFARIGGDGRHGTFDVTLGVDNGIVNGLRQYTFDTGNTIIPAANTTTGSSIPVSDGRFFFDKMIVPSDVRLRFTGTTSPPVFTVCGRLDILGEIFVSGSSVPLQTGTPTLGQAGGAAGIFGGAGGKGGDKCLGTGTGIGSQFSGQDGQPGQVIASHGYASSAAGTRGKGALLHPASGLKADLIIPPAIPSWTLGYQVKVSPGGGGGAHWQPGVAGRVVMNNHHDPVFTGAVSTAAGVDTIEVASANWVVNGYVGGTITILVGSPGAGQTRTVTANTANTITVNSPWAVQPVGSLFSVSPRLDAMGPPAPGGTAMQLFNFPPPTGSQKSSVHFLVGGGGGGGAASHACLALLLNNPAHPVTWTVGGGGAGGGGAIALRAGDSLTLAASGKILAVGGSTPNSTGTSSSAVPTPGGAGAGGAVVLQSARAVDASGLIDVRGGIGGNWQRSGTGSPNSQPYTTSVTLNGGNGGNGFVRLEAPGTVTTSALANMQPAPIAQNVGTLTESDDLVAMRSLFYSTDLLFGPEYIRYVIHATVDGVPVVYSDDPAVSNIPAQVGEALQVQFQAATVDLQTGEVLETREWRNGVRTFGGQVGIASDGLNAFRFRLIIDHVVAQNVTVDKIEVPYLH